MTRNINLWPTATLLFHVHVFRKVLLQTLCLGGLAEEVVPDVGYQPLSERVIWNRSGICTQVRAPKYRLRTKHSMYHYFTERKCFLCQLPN